jgi:hypothetical protein
MPSYAKDPAGSHGIICDHRGHVYFRFGHDGERQGSEPLASQTREQAHATIRRLFEMNGVYSVEIIDARTE